MTKLDANELTNQVIHGDCLDVLAEMPDNFVSTIITDPPYGLKFMSKNWDHGIPGIPFWAEMLRVAKPGATLLAFGGTRTHHRLMVAIEDAGWEIKDVIMYLFGSGFPKSHNISKAIDKAAGKEREVIGERRQVQGEKSIMRRATQAEQGYRPSGAEFGQLANDTFNVTAPATEAAATWEGFGTGLKPAYEPIIYAQKPIEQNYANNAQVWGVAGLNIDGSRISTQDDLNGGQYSGAEKQNGAVYGDHRNLSPEQYQQPSGRWPANVLLSHSEGCVRRGEKRVRGHNGYPKGPGGNSEVYRYSISGHSEDFRETAKTGHADPNGLETVADWECVDSCAIRILDEQAGVRKSGARDLIGHNKPKGSTNFGGSDKATYESSTGSASRFFYTSKAPNREKWFYCQLCAQAYPNQERDNHGHDIPKDQRKHIIAHPTVKPLEILKYLCTLTKTPTGGIVLDPFAGSGTTALACLETGRDFILIEKESDYYEIAKARVEDAMSKPRQLDLLK